MKFEWASARAGPGASAGAIAMDKANAEFDGLTSEQKDSWYKQRMGEDPAPPPPRATVSPLRMSPLRMARFKLELVHNRCRELESDAANTLSHAQLLEQCKAEYEALTDKEKADFYQQGVDKQSAERDAAFRRQEEVVGYAIWNQRDKESKHVLYYHNH